MNVRACSSLDLPEVQRIYAHHVRTGTGSFEEEPPALEEMQSRHAKIAALGFPFLVAEDKGQILGYAYAGPYHARSAYRFTCENSVYVAAEAQRRGVGLALMSEVILACEQRGLRRMLALVGDSSNQGSIGLHTKLGFRRAGVLQGVGFKAGRWLDVVLMQRDLGASASG